MTIFLSYSSRNQDQIARLAEILRNFDKDVFVEQKSLGGSISWEQAFGKIKNCDLFTIALTQYSLNSAARKLEMEYAAALKKPILVILLEDVGALPPELNAAATVQFRENYEPSLTVFSDAIRQVVPPAEAMTEATPPDWSTALADAQQRLQTASMPLYEQRRLAVSLRDLLERRE
ncbi:MAG: toll/interleukin-1 receptor domain-containing protein, partial [Anaerolineae bacterium]